MQKHREANGAEEVRATLPNGGALMGAQRAAAENATRIANAACHYALFVNKAWVELCGDRLNAYLELPKRFVNAQSDFVEQAVDHYQESLQKLGDLATKATQHAQSAVKETQAAGERVARQFQSDFKNMAQGNGQGGNEEHCEAAH